MWRWVCRLVLRLCHCRAHESCYCYRSQYLFAWCGIVPSNMPCFGGSQCRHEMSVVASNASSGNMCEAIGLLTSTTLCSLPMFCLSFYPGRIPSHPSQVDLYIAHVDSCESSCDVCVLTSVALCPLPHTVSLCMRRQAVCLSLDAVPETYLLLCPCDSSSGIIDRPVVVPGTIAVGCYTVPVICPCIPLSRPNGVLLTSCAAVLSWTLMRSLFSFTLLSSGGITCLSYCRVAVAAALSYVQDLMWISADGDDVVVACFE